MYFKGNMIYYFTGQAKLEKCNIGSYRTTYCIKIIELNCINKSMSSIGVAQMINELSIRDLIWNTFIQILCVPLLSSSSMWHGFVVV